MTATATLGGGCFWCIEAAMKELNGVESVISGYAGGRTSDPTYQEVCSGTTGHAEVVQIEYDPGTVSYLELLEVFFKIHDPTTRDRQGPDVGSQYRSIVLYHDDDQREQAEGFIERLDTEVYDDGIVTEVKPLEHFYEAEAYHQDYYEKQRDSDGNIQDAYCTMHAKPKVEKVRKEFAENVKPAARE